MYKILSVLVFLIISGKAWAQILPKENSKLNYRIIGFSFPLIHDVSNYKIEISTGTYNTEDSFRKHIIVSFSGDSNKIIGEVPAFGKEYTWRYIGMNPEETKSNLYHFSTGIAAEVDTNVVRLRVMKKAEKQEDAYIFSDATRTLYDMNGVPVWYLPESKEIPGSDKLIYAEFKITNNGTITFSSLDKAFQQRVYEINYDGDILWTLPNNSKVNRNSKGYYQKELGKLTNGRYKATYPGINPNAHEFTRLANGHYMLLGSDSLLLKLPADTDSVLLY